MTSRRLAAVPLLALVAGPLVALSGPAGAAPGPDIASTGFLTTPFREDRAPFDRTTGTFGGARGDDGCIGDVGKLDCLPAGASQTVLGDGRVLYWNAIEGGENLETAAVPEGGERAQNDSSRALTLDYAAPGSSRWRDTGDGFFPGTPGEPGLLPGQTPEANGNDGSLFCSDNKFLADGRVVAFGGTNYYAEPRINDRFGVLELEGVKNARAFNPASNQWQRLPDMKYGRWYPSMVTLPDADVFVAGGVTKLIKPVYPTHPLDSGGNVTQTERYDFQTNAFVDNGPTATRSLPLFPRLHLLSNGQVYYGAAGQSFNPFGQSYDQALWNLAAVYDPATRSWRDLGVPGLTTAGKTTSPGGYRGSTFQQQLVLKPGPDGKYRTHSFLAAGGVVGGSPGSYVPVDSARIDQVTVGTDAARTASVDSFDAGRLQSGARWYPSGVVLPNGQVFVTSGADVDHVIGPGAEMAQRQTEIFTPNATQTGGTWSLGPKLDRDRTYHNSAVLLPTGQVLIGGHAPIPNGYGTVRNNPDTPVRDFANNFKDASFQIYTPPNLARGERRPVITGEIPARLDNGDRLTIPTQDAAEIASVVLVRNPSVTHVIDGDQRTVELPITGRSGSSLEVALSESASVLPPGPYMLFLNRRTVAADKVTPNDLVPSIAKQVYVGDVKPVVAQSLPQSADSPAAPGQKQKKVKKTKPGAPQVVGVGAAEPGSAPAPVAPVTDLGDARLAAGARDDEPVSPPLPAAPALVAAVLVVAAGASVRHVRRRVLLR